MLGDTGAHRLRVHTQSELFRALAIPSIRPNQKVLLNITLGGSATKADLILMWL